LTGDGARRLSVWPATAMIVAETIGVGILLTPAAMARTLPSAAWVIGVWLFVGGLSAAGALCYAELATRFPEAGGGYVFLREAFGARLAFLYGWMSLLVMDPGLTAALAIGLAQYLLVVFGVTGGSAMLTKGVAILAIASFGAISFTGVAAAARVIRWTAVAKLLIVALLLVAGVISSGTARSAGAAAAASRSAASSASDSTRASAATAANADDAASAADATRPAMPLAAALGAATIAAFFAFGGWWDLGKMSAEVIDPRRTLPPALIGGVALVTVIYVLVTLSFLRVAPGAAAATDEAFVSAVGTQLFGEAAGRLLAAMVVIAVAGSLAAVLLVAPRVYLAMARDGLFPARLGRFDASRGAARGATLVQVTLAVVLVLLGTFDTILGYFVPAAVFFLGLSAAAMLALPRPPDDGRVFRAPAYPVPILAFLLLVIGMLALFAIGRPIQTLLGAAVVALGVPVAWLVVSPRSPRAA
jgi:APA family basic amino acid/polyamine antiporter